MFPATHVCIAKINHSKQLILLEKQSHTFCFSTLISS